MSKLYASWSLEIENIVAPVTGPDQRSPVQGTVRGGQSRVIGSDLQIRINIAPSRVPGSGDESGVDSLSNLS